MQLSDAPALKARIKDGFCLGVPGEENPETRVLYCISGTLVFLVAGPDVWQIVLLGAERSISREVQRIL